MSGSEIGRREPLTVGVVEGKIDLRCACERATTPPFYDNSHLKL
jgi:hypothetical protein